jgi:hypothetical protein
MVERKTMAKDDHQTKTPRPRVLTDAEIDTLSFAQLKKLVREGRAVWPDADQMLKEAIRAELAGSKEDDRERRLRAVRQRPAKYQIN